MHDPGTIVAISTPTGRSGIGVIRVSGENALSCLLALTNDQGFHPEPNRATLKTIRHPKTREVLDRALVTYFKSPNSFTGEDVVELSCHGSPPLLLELVQILLSLGARAADPGEFTMRALVNRRIDLSQAEAVRDLINAQTYASVRNAARQVGGELSNTLRPVKEQLIDIIVPLESSIEFVEDDLPDDINRGIRTKLAQLAAELENLAGTYSKGRLLKDGLRVALVGRPNAGKSSLFNRLLRSERAIVTAVPGTTRDTLDEAIIINDVAVRLTDTAGIRTSADEIEQIGIERTRRAIADSDLIVVVVDGADVVTSDDHEIISEAASNHHVIAVNKSDLESFRPIDLPTNGSAIVEVSARTGAGIDALCNAILQPFSAGGIQEADVVITNARHHDFLNRAAESLRASQRESDAGAGEELVLVGLYDALRFLGEITGETTAEDVLSQIFATFCIGK
jgi:tRNA modification GTPase